MADKIEALLDCPFCGCAAGYVKHSAGVKGTQGFDSWDAVACKHCRATVGACDRRFRCREDARDAWNRRIPTASAPAAEREPLTPERIEALRDEVLDRLGPMEATFVDFTRAIEAAHGIGTKEPAP